jgi:hypothetical protein
MSQNDKSRYSASIFRIVTATTHFSKGKAIPLQARIGPEGSSRLRLPDFKKVVRLSALRTDRLYPTPQEVLLVLISDKG